jgi:hypothetical protein
VVVRVGLPVRDAVELLERLAPAGVVDPHEQLVLRRVVALRPRERHQISGMIRHAEPEAVGLHFPVGRPVFAGMRRRDARQHAARGIARHDVRTDRLLHRAEVMAMVKHTRLNAVPRLSVGRHRLAADVIIHARRRHEVAFVGGVDEHPSRVGAAAHRANRRDSRAVARDPARAVQPLVAHDRDLMLAHELLEHRLGHVRLEHPHRPVLAVDRRRALAAIAELLAPLPAPGVGRLIPLPHAVVALAREPANHRLVARVGEAEPARRQAAEIAIGRDDDRPLAEPGCLHGGNHRRRRAAVDDHVVRAGALRAKRRTGGRGQQDLKERTAMHRRHGQLRLTDGRAESLR